jgi:hypothetical protein
MKPSMTVVFERLTTLQFDKLEDFLFYFIWTVMEKFMAVSRVEEVTIISQGENGLTNFHVSVPTV